MKWEYIKTLKVSQDAQPPMTYSIGVVTQPSVSHTITEESES